MTVFAKSGCRTCSVEVLLSCIAAQFLVNHFVLLK